MVVSLGVVAYRIWGSWENIQAAFNWKCLLVLLLFTLYVMGSYITYAVLYKKVLEEMAGRTISINICQVMLCIMLAGTKLLRMAWSLISR